MLNHVCMGLGVIAMLIGCSGAPATEFESQPEQSNCPDPPTCTAGNGTGIYAAEGGFAGIKALVPVNDVLMPRAIMITHFTMPNPASPNAVTFAYGYFEPTSNVWTPLPGVGRVESADLAQQPNYQVIGVAENDTAVQWTLRDPAGTNVTVSDAQVADLILHVSFTVPGRSPRILADLGFAAPSITPVSGHFKKPVRVYDLRWRNLTDFPGVAPQPYCHGPNNAPDTAIFQQGINVDPVNGTITRPRAPVITTLSCSLGAMAVVRRWGYSYLGVASDTFYFDAGIHMKRASYCGDANYYTVSGTQIQIVDDRGIQNDVFPLSLLEAQWTPSGASCAFYNRPDNRRHPEMGFTGVCGGKTMNPCTGSASSPFLADGIVTAPAPSPPP